MRWRLTTRLRAAQRRMKGQWAQAGEILAAEDCLAHREYRLVSSVWLTLPEQVAQGLMLRKTSRLMGLMMLLHSLKGWAARERARRAFEQNERVRWYAAHEV